MNREKSNSGIGLDLLANKEKTKKTGDSFFGTQNIHLSGGDNDRGSGDGIFRMEFPLMQWLVAGSYYVFGKSVLVTRLFMFGVGLLSVLGVYKLLLILFKKELLAIIGAWAFNFSPSFFY